MVYSPVTISRIFICSVSLLVTYDKIRRAKKLMIQLKSNFVIYDSEDAIYWILKYLKPNISNNSSKRTVTSLSFNPFSNITIPSLPSLMNYKFRRRIVSFKRRYRSNFNSKRFQLEYTASEYFQLHQKKKSDKESYKTTISIKNSKQFQYVNSNKFQSLKLSKNQKIIPLESKHKKMMEKKKNWRGIIRRE